MNRFQIENLYISNGLSDFRLRDSQDLIKTHGINIEDIKGFNMLTENYQELFKKFIVNIFNAIGLESRSSLLPLAINYVEDIEYLIKESPENDYFTIIGGVIKAIFADGKKKIIHRWLDKDYKNFKISQGKPMYYLRFEYKHGSRKEWLHVMNETSWY